MKKSLKHILALSAGAMALASSYSAQAQPDSITVAYFLEWPTPNLYAQSEGVYDEEMGLEVNWRAFDSGVAMSAAMASGDVDIAFSQGSVPFVNAVTPGLPLKSIGIAVSYAENDNCVVRDGTGIDKTNAVELEGKKVAVPFGTVPHYKLLVMLQHLGVNTDNINLLDMAPDQGFAALARGDVSLACGWGGVLNRMKEHGEVLLTATELEEIGLLVVDVISTTNDFAAEYPEVLTQFLQVTEDMNDRYKDDAEAAVMLPVIAQASGMDEAATKDNLSKFTFLTAEEQVNMLENVMPNFMRGVAEFFEGNGELSNVLEDYSATIDTSFLKQVQ